MGVSLRFDFVPITQQFHVANLSIPAPEYPNEFRKVIPHNGSATLVISVEKIMDSQLKRCEPKTARGVIIDDYASKTGPIPVNGTAVVSAYYSRTVPGVCSNVKATAPIVNFGLNWR